MRLFHTAPGSRPSLARLSFVTALAGVLLYSAVQLVVSPLLPVSAQGYPSPPLVSGAPPPGTQPIAGSQQTVTVGSGGPTVVVSTAGGSTASLDTTGLPPGSTFTISQVNPNSLGSTVTGGGGILSGAEIVGSGTISGGLMSVTISFVGLELNVGNPDLVVSNQTAPVDLSDVLPVLWSGSRWLNIPGAVKTRDASGKISVQMRTPPGLVALIRARANVFEAPPQAGGMVLGVSGTNQPNKLATAQRFDVGVIFAGSGFERRYIPGGPAFVQTMDDINLSVNDVVLAVRRAPAPGVGTTGGSAAVSGSTYTVVAGDTLSGIGVKTGVDWMRIATANNLSSPYLLQIGQVLTIPR